jgi:hypothetical protein
MRILKYLESKEIDHGELEEHFKLVNKISMDTDLKTCPHCRDSYNIYRYRASAWSSAAHCISCRSIIYVIHTDSMGSCLPDTVYVYQEKRHHKEEQT